MQIAMQIAREINRRLDLLVKDKDKRAPAPDLKRDTSSSSSLGVALAPAPTHGRSNSMSQLLPVAKGENPLESEDVVIQEELVITGNLTNF